MDNPLVAPKDVVLNLLALDRRAQQYLVSETDRISVITALTRETLIQTANIVASSQQQVTEAALMRAAIEHMMEQTGVLDELTALHLQVMWREFLQQMSTVTQNGMEALHGQHLHSLHD